MNRLQDKWGFSPQTHIFNQQRRTINIYFYTAFGQQYVFPPFPKVQVSEHAKEEKWNVLNTIQKHFWIEIHVTFCPTGKTETWKKIVFIFLWPLYISPYILLCSLVQCKLFYTCTLWYVIIMFRRKTGVYITFIWDEKPINQK